MTDLKWNISKIISYIRSNAGFRALLVNADDSIMDEVYTFADNGCGSCKKTILTFIDVNREVINKIIDEFVTKHPNHEEECRDDREPTSVNQQEEPKQPRTPTRAAGDVFEIEADPEAYKEFVEWAQKERLVYRGLNILPENGKWQVFLY